MVLKRLKNTTNQLLYVNGTGLPVNEYYTIPENEYLQYISDQNLLRYISEGKLIVNDGFSDILNIIEAWNFLIGRNEPPKTNEGFWTILSKRESELDDSEIFNVVFSRCVNPGSSFEEYIVIPPNKKMKLLNFIADSPTCPIFTFVEYYVKMGDSYYCHNNMINPDYVYDFEVDEDYNTGSEFIKVKHNSFYQTIYYKNHDNKLFSLNISSQRKYFISSNFNENEMKLYLNPLNFSISKGTKLLNTNIQLFSVGSESHPSMISFGSPLVFSWNDESYIKLYCRNISSKDVSLINIVLNGYFRNKD